MQVRVRTAVDSDTGTVADIRLREPQVRYNRLMEPIWLKLRRQGDSYVASYSFDAGGGDGEHAQHSEYASDDSL